MMKQSIAIVAAAIVVAGCGSRINYHDVPPPTQEKKPVIDVAPEDTSGAMKARALRLKKRIAVARFGDTARVEGLPFQRDEALVAHAGGPERLTEMLINLLLKTGRFDIVERKDIEAVVKELEFGESKWIDKARAAKAGSVLGAQFLLMASAGRNVDAAGRVAGDVLVHLRMVDVATSRITASVLGAGPDLHGATAHAVVQLVKTSEQAPWVGKIADVRGTEIVIDAGKDLGLKPGDTFAVFTLGEPVEDPDSGQTLGYREEGAGTITIAEVKDRFSLATPVTLNRQVKPGDLVRPAIEK